jgi:PQQ-like domain
VPLVAASMALLIPVMFSAVGLVEPEAGRRDWVARYDGPRHKNDYPYTVAASPDGRSIFVSGTSYVRATGNCSDYATVAYDSLDGTQLWSAEHDGSGSSCDDVVDAALSADGALLFVTGTSPSIDSSDDVVTVAYNTADGSVRWVAHEDGPFHARDLGAGVFTSTDTRTVFVAGSFQVTPCEDDLDPCQYVAAAMAYDAMTGALRWRSEFDSPEHTTLAAGIAGNGDTLFVPVTGLGSSIHIVAFELSTGTQRWVATFNKVYEFEDIAVSADGRLVFLAGVGRDTRYRVAAFDTADGSLRWVVSRGSAIFDAASLGAPPTSGAVFFAAESRFDYLVLSIDGEDGSTIWKARYDGPGGGDTPTGIVASTDGTRVYVTGSSTRGGTSYGPSFGTIAFNAADGTIIWLDRYGGRIGGYHIPYALTATPDGGVVVTGESEGEDGWTDFATIEYAGTA